MLKKKTLQKISILVEKNSQKNLRDICTLKRLLYEDSVLSFSSLLVHSEQSP